MKEVDIEQGRGSQFQVTDWTNTVDLGSITSDIINYVLRDYINSAIFDNDSLQFSAALTASFLTEDEESDMEYFGRYLFRFVFYF